jgi:urease accessory protein
MLQPNINQNDASKPHAELVFSPAPDGRTFISHQRVGYPFHITRPFYLDKKPEGFLTLYMQSVSGGIYRGEKLFLNMKAESGSFAQVTTQSATIVHRMKEDGVARQDVVLRVADDAFFEYLPDPLILFPGASFENKMRVIADPGATVIICDAFSQHDSREEGGCFRRLVSDTRIEDPSGKLLALDRFDIDGNVELAHLSSSENCYPDHGILMVLHKGCPIDELVAEIRSSLINCQGIYSGVSIMPFNSGVWVRILAQDGHSLRTALNAAWVRARYKISGTNPSKRPK